MKLLIILFLWYVLLDKCKGSIKVRNINPEHVLPKKLMHLRLQIPGRGIRMNNHNVLHRRTHNLPKETTHHSEHLKPGQHRNEDNLNTSGQHDMDYSNDDSMNWNESPSNNHHKRVSIDINLNIKNHNSGPEMNVDASKLPKEVANEIPENNSIPVKSSFSKENGKVVNSPTSKGIENIGTNPFPVENLKNPVNPKTGITQVNKLSDNSSMENEILPKNVIHDNKVMETLDDEPLLEDVKVSSKMISDLEGSGSKGTGIKDTNSIHEKNATPTGSNPFPEKRAENSETTQSSTIDDKKSISIGTNPFPGKGGKTDVSTETNPLLGKGGKTDVPIGTNPFPGKGGKTVVSTGTNPHHGKGGKTDVPVGTNPFPGKGGNTETNPFLGKGGNIGTNPFPGRGGNNAPSTGTNPFPGRHRNTAPSTGTNPFPGRVGKAGVSTGTNPFPEKGGKTAVNIKNTPLPTGKNPFPSKGVEKAIDKNPENSNLNHEKSFNPVDAGNTDEDNLTDVPLHGITKKSSVHGNSSGMSGAAAATKNLQNDMKFTV